MQCIKKKDVLTWLKKWVEITDVWICKSLHELLWRFGGGGGSHYIDGRQDVSQNMGCAQKADLLEFLDIDVSRDFFPHTFPGPFKLSQVRMLQ